MFSSQMGGHGRMPLLNKTLGGSNLGFPNVAGSKALQPVCNPFRGDTYVHGHFHRFPYDIYKNSKMKYSQIPK